MNAREALTFVKPGMKVYDRGSDDESYSGEVQEVKISGSLLILKIKDLQKYNDDNKSWEKIKDSQEIVLDMSSVYVSSQGSQLVFNGGPYCKMHISFSW